MSLVRLLTAGKTLIGLKRTEGRYQLPGGRPLPMFGSKKNPFRATVFPDKTEPVTVPEQPADGTGAAPPACVSEDRPAELAPHQEDKTAGEGEPGAKAKDSPQKNEPANEGKSPLRGASAFRAFLLWRRVKKISAPGGLKNRSLVQAELSLDAVKVVRNDLSESDLEIVPASSKRASSEKPVLSAERKPRADGLEWSEAPKPLLSAVKM